ncbi:hypothetical protein Ancab_026001 [Ancistrocladus abbreviatus]
MGMLLYRLHWLISTRKLGRVDIARSVLDRMSEPDLVAWNALISGYSLNGLDYEALKIVSVKGLKPNVSTLASIVPICTRLGYLNTGKSLHGYAVKSGFNQDELLLPALISFYGSNGDVIAARGLFDVASIKNTVIWNSMIYAYTKNLQSSEAYEMFWQMLCANFQPNIVTFISIIPCCENLSSIWRGECLHVYMVKHGLEKQVSVATALISMYSKLGYLDSAKILFDQVTNKNLLTWNSMISGYVCNGLWSMTLDAVHELRSAGFDPDAITIISILFSCSELKALLLGKSAHAFSVRRGLDSKLNLSNMLLGFYSNFHQVSSSFKLFQKMEVRNLVSWNTIISGCAHNGDPEKALALFQQMQQENVVFDLVTLISILPCCSGSDDLIRGMAIHGYAVRSGLSNDVSLANALISMYSNCGDLNAAAMLFDMMPERSVISWNSLLTSFVCQHLHNEAMLLFREMVNNHQKPNYVTLLNVVPICCTLLQGKSVHAYAVRTEAVLLTPLLTSMILMYARFDKMASCFSLFAAGDKLNISLWNSVMSTLVQARDAKKAIALFCELLQTELKPDYVTILSLISACVQLNSSSISHSLLAFMFKEGFLKDATLSNALIDLHAKCGDISVASNLFEELLDKDAISWTVMINGYGLHGDGKAAFNLLLDMVDSGLQPDGITYLSVLSACSHAGLVEESRIVLNSMHVQGIQPSIEHYACVLDLLGRRGHLNEAYGIVKELHCQPSVSMLHSLLGACKVHGDLELGMKIGELLLEKDSKDPGVYVVLHNMYAGTGRWADADRMRAQLGNRALMKVPGFSLLEGSRHQDMQPT